jgi:predicted nucleic acid-binding protein
MLFDEIVMPTVVLEDLLNAKFIGFDVPSPFDLPWVSYDDPQITVPSAWVSLDLSSGEVAAMSLAFENADCIVLLDDPAARRAARVVGLHYWGTLKILLEAKARGLAPEITPYVDRLASSSILLSAENRRRILTLAGEDPHKPVATFPVAPAENRPDDKLDDKSVSTLPVEPSGNQPEDKSEGKPVSTSSVAPSGDQLDEKSDDKSGSKLPVTPAEAHLDEKADNKSDDE